MNPRQPGRTQFSNRSDGAHAQNPNPLRKNIAADKPGGGLATLIGRSLLPAVSSWRCGIWSLQLLRGRSSARQSERSYTGCSGLAPGVFIQSGGDASHTPNRMSMAGLRRCGRDPLTRAAESQCRGMAQAEDALSLAGRAPVRGSTLVSSLFSTCFARSTTSTQTGAHGG